ncbi:MAG: ABC transporter ATP-binding protein [Ilumatobacteraceae bacterium]
MDSRPQADDLVVEVERVSKRFTMHGRDEIALHEVSLHVPRGSLVAVAGPSGSGKSTLLSIIGCLARPTSGSVRFEGVEITELSRSRRRALRRTELTNLLPLPSDNLFHRTDGYGNVRRASGRRATTRDEVTALLDRFGIAHCGPKRVIDMSGGEQQRLAPVCALVRTPKLIVADEPTASLDRANARLVIDALVQAATLGTTVIVATHDHDLIEAATSAVHLSHGVVVAVGGVAPASGGTT